MGPALSHVRGERHFAGRERLSRRGALRPPVVTAFLLPPDAVPSRCRVIYGDTDQMGVVYYANYFRFFEAARNEYFRAHGGSYREVEAQGFILPITEAHATYRASAKYDDLLRVDAWVSQVRRVSLRFDYRLSRDDGDALLAEGYTVHACLGVGGKPTRLPLALLARLPSLETP